MTDHDRWFVEEWGAHPVQTGLVFLLCLLLGLVMLPFVVWFWLWDAAQALRWRR